MLDPDDTMSEQGESTAQHVAPYPNPLEELSLQQLRTRTSMKWRAHPADVLPLWVAEMDVRLAPSIASALHAAIDAGDTGYPAGTRYAEELAAFAHRRWNWDGLAVERTTVVPDVMMGIVELLRLITDPGDCVVVNAPVYAPFYAFVSHADRRIVEARLGQDSRIDIEALEEAFLRAKAVSRQAVFLLSNPHNPTGVVHTREELEVVAGLARRHGVRVISDEIHAPLVLTGASFTPYLSVPGSEDAFALMSASKGWNLAGLKAAIAIAGAQGTDDLRRMPEEVSHGPSHLGIIAHTAAFKEGDDWLNALLLGLESNRALLSELLEQHLPMVRCTPSEGTYLAWLDCRALGLENDDRLDGPGIVTDLAGPAQFFLEKAKVALSSGHVFGTGGAGHVRLNFATSPEILREAVRRMSSAVPR